MIGLKFRRYYKKNNCIYDVDLNELETLMLDEDNVILQYIGSKDKNGIEIYEGDILQTKDFYECGELVFKGKKEKIENLDYYLKHCAFIDTTGEVIGNIYENPELLEE